MTSAAERRPMTDAEAIQFVIDEMESEYEEVKTRIMSDDRSVGFRSELIAAHWVRIFLGEDAVKSALAGIPVGHIINDEIKLGRKVPAEIQACRDAWWANIVAYDMTRPSYERWTPEGKEAATRARQAPKRTRRASV